MKMGLICASLAATCFAGMAMADLRPMARPAAIAEVSLAPAEGLRPMGRPASIQAAPAMLAVDPTLLAAVRVAAIPVPDFFASAKVASSTLVPGQPDMFPMDNPVLSVSTSGQIMPLPLRPRLRPEGLNSAISAVVVMTPPSALRLASTLRPEPRPAVQSRQQPEAEVIPAAVVRVLPGKEGVVGKKGSVCGDPSIRGQTIAPISSRVRGCGVPDAVEITSVAGVKLSEPATIDCNTARALSAWVEQGLQPQFSGDPVVKLQVAGSYACRPRNNVKGNKISEHGKGKAIDIAGFVLASGNVVTVTRDWRTKAEGRLIKAAYKAACGIFTTTLGPGSDGYHEDHMHFDTASGRGPYCR